MKTFSLDRLKSLAQHHDPPCVSIYIPTHRHGEGTQQDPIRFRNMLNAIEQDLLKSGMSPREVQSLLNPAYTLLGDFFFWKHQYDSLAVFISKNSFHYSRLPYTLSEQFFIGETYTLKPLLPLFANNGRYYVLAICHNEVRLFEGTRDSLGQVDLPDTLTARLKDILKANDSEYGLLLRTISNYGGISYPQNTNDSPIQPHHLLSIVDDELRSVLADENVPLILAGAECLFPIFREVSGYHNIVKEGIRGDVKTMSAYSLHEDAWNIVEPFFRLELERTTHQYYSLYSSQKATDKLEDIIPAAYHGRVERLIVAVDRFVWGKFNPESGKVYGCPNRKHLESDISLTDFAAMQTLKNGGKIYALSDEEMPANAPMLAILR
jgi:hypothetical protein